MPENSDKCLSQFQSMLTYTNVFSFFCLTYSPQPKEILFTITENKANQQIFYIRRAGTSEFWHCCLNNLAALIHFKSNHNIFFEFNLAELLIKLSGTSS